jgi:hypothetical protein
MPIPDALDVAKMSIPPPLPDGRVRFELARPGCWERVMSEQRHQAS